MVFPLLLGNLIAPQKNADPRLYSYFISHYINFKTKQILQITHKHIKNKKDTY